MRATLRLTAASALALLAILGACSKSASLPLDEQRLLTFGADTVQGQGTVTELRQRRAQWVANAPRSYTYVHAASCFCAPSYRQPVNVDVEAGVVTAVRVAATGEPVPDATTAHASIEMLFDRAIAAAQRGDYVEVTYDAAFGAPVRLVLGTLANDAGVAHYLSAVRPR